MPFRLDLHTHSIVSHDGGITGRQYNRILKKQKMDFIAVTDHNATHAAEELQKNLGDQIIVGEEIRTTSGDIVGLFLNTAIPKGLTLAEAIQAVKAQNGLVYVPHPWESFRKGLETEALEEFASEFDIVEVFNSRTRQGKYTARARQFAEKHNIAMASSSDAHGASGIGRSYVEIDQRPTRENLLELLRGGRLVCRYASLISYAHPAINKFKRKLGIKNV
jgi:predicted metal-dependent phosphoesterase TrpH